MLRLMLCLDLQGSHPSRIGTRHAVLASPGFANNNRRPTIWACYPVDLVHVSHNMSAKKAVSNLLPAGMPLACCTKALETE